MGYAVTTQTIEETTEKRSAETGTIVMLDEDIGRNLEKHIFIGDNYGEVPNDFFKKPDQYELWKNINNIYPLDCDIRVILQWMLGKTDDKYTETIPSEYQANRNKKFAPNVIISPAIAAKIRNRDIKSFIPVTTANLVWLESRSTDIEDDD